MSAILPTYLADTHHQVRMLVATSTEKYAQSATVTLWWLYIFIDVPPVLFCISRLFLEIKPESPGKRRMLPLKHQQAAFESVYLKAQEGMRLPVRAQGAEHLITVFFCSF